VKRSEQWSRSLNTVKKWINSGKSSWNRWKENAKNSSHSRCKNAFKKEKMSFDNAKSLFNRSKKTNRKNVNKS
jgi:hypothetical protein